MVKNMAWKPEYAAARKKKAQENPEYREKRNQQSCTDKEARKIYMTAYYAANPEMWPKKDRDQLDEKNAARRARYAQNSAHREKMKKKSQEWSKANPEKVKHARLMSAFGMSLDQFNAMMELQGNACAICGYSDMSNPKVFHHVDHCHSTGKVRGILCTNCNTALGKFKDDTSLLYSAISYLIKHG